MSRRPKEFTKSRILEAAEGKFPACPSCDALPGDPCRSPRFKVVSPHGKRKALIENARALEQPRKVKLCIWLGPDGRPLPESGMYLQTSKTEAKPNAPVFIVPYDENGHAEQADIYFHGGAAIAANVNDISGFVYSIPGEDAKMFTMANTGGGDAGKTG